MPIALKHICTFQSGGTPSKSNAEYFNGSIPWITTVALNGRTIGENNAVDWITEKAIQESAAKIVPAQSIMVGTRVGVGKVAVNSVPMSTSQDIISLVGIDENRWSKDYICKFIQSKGSFLLAQARGATIKGIKIDVLADLQIPEIALEEQRKIVNTLEHLLDSIDTRQKQLDTLDQLIKARFVELFGDPTTNGKGFETRPGIEVFKLSNGKFVPENKRFETGVPVYGGNGISWYTDEILCDNDTVVVGRVGFQSGNVHLVEGPLWISDNAMYISDLVDNEYDLRFLYAVMDHIDFTRFQDAGDLKKITQKPFMQMQYIKPPLNIQREYIAFVSQVDKSKLSIQASLDQLETMKQSLMQKYFILGDCKSP